LSRRSTKQGARLVRTRPAALAACVTCAVLTAAACGGTPTAEPAPEAGPPATVSVAPVKEIDEPVTVEATGSFQPDESSDVAPESSGRVIATPVDVGQYVKHGAVLIRIQDVNAKLRLDEVRAATTRAEANLKLAEAGNDLAQTTAKRHATLLANGLVPLTVADEARTQAETTAAAVHVARASLGEARAQLALAEKAVADVVVAAPFAGYISQRRVAVGEWVQPSTAVVTLLRIDPLRLQLTIPAVQAGSISAGQAVRARVDAFPQKVFEGKITAVNPAITAESRSFIVEARVPNPGAALKPGMFAVATIDQGRTERALLVPERAVIEDANTNSFRVYVVDQENKARLRVVQLAARQARTGATKILTGITEGERVATSGLGELYDGAPVTPSPGAAQE
ncbi:MAG: efflux RND transporter periplasmic adaptor subunit, partial [Vicinamibacterales bacterium]